MNSSYIKRASYVFLALAIATTLNIPSELRNNTIQPIVEAAPVSEVLQSEVVVHTPEESVSKVLVGKESYLPLVQRYAEKYGITSEEIISIVDCEDTPWDPDLQSYHHYTEAQLARNPSWAKYGAVVGGRELSFGLAQIHIPAGHKWNGEVVTETMARNAEFSIEFLAYHLSKGHRSMWSCSALID